MIKLTGNKTFSKKTFALVCNTKEMILVNLWGFGLWVLRSQNAIDAWTKYNHF